MARPAAATWLERLAPKLYRRAQWQLWHFQVHGVVARIRVSPEMCAAVEDVVVR